MRISDWSSDVCSSDLSAVGFLLCCQKIGIGPRCLFRRDAVAQGRAPHGGFHIVEHGLIAARHTLESDILHFEAAFPKAGLQLDGWGRISCGGQAAGACRSEEQTSELQSLMRISYAVFCLKKKIK